MWIFNFLHKFCRSIFCEAKTSFRVFRTKAYNEEKTPLFSFLVVKNFGCLYRGEKKKSKFIVLKSFQNLHFLSIWNQIWFDMGVLRSAGVKKKQQTLVIEKQQLQFTQQLSLHTVRRPHFHSTATCDNNHVI